MSIFFENKTLSGIASAVVTGAAFAAASLPSARAQGGEMANVANYGFHHNLGTQPMYDNAVAVTARNALGREFTASGLLIAPNVVMGAGHFSPGEGSTTVISHVTLGDNYNTGQRYRVTHSERFPGYQVGNVNTIDLAFYYLEEYIPNVPRVTFASPVINRNATIVDYGNFGDRFTGELASLGDKLGGSGPLFNNPATNYPFASYISMRMEGPRGYKGAQFTSGAPGYDQDGNPVFIATAATFGFNGGGSTVGVILDRPQIHEVTDPIIQHSYDQAAANTPEPAGAGLLAAGALAGLSMRNRRRAA